MTALATVPTDAAATLPRVTGPRAVLHDDGSDAPPAVLLAHLRRARAAGASFDEAWTSGMRVALPPQRGEERTNWAYAFRETRSSWQDAYRGAQPCAAAGALEMVRQAA